MPIDRESESYRAVMASVASDVQATMQLAMAQIQAAKAHVMLLGRWTTNTPICVKLDKMMQEANEVSRLAKELTS